MYRQKGIEILCAGSPIDPFLMQFIEKKISPVTFQRIDAGIDDHILDKDREKIIVDASGRTEAARLADFIRGKLSDDKIEVEAKSLAAESLPGFIMMDENQRRMRDYMLQLDPKEGLEKMHMIGKRTFVVNTNNPLITAIQKLDHVNPELAKDMVKQTYELALLSQHEMDPSLMNDFIARSNRVMENLAKLIAEKPVA